MAELCKAIVRQALQHAYRAFQPVVGVKIRYVSVPKYEVHEVRAARDYDKGLLMLVPLSPCLGVCMPNKVPSTAVVVKSVPLCPPDHVFFIAPFACMSRPIKPTAPYWAIPVGCQASLAHGSAVIHVESTSETGEPSKYSVKLPVLYNKNPVKKGDVLTRPDPASAASPSAIKRSASSSTAAAKKRQRSAN